MKSLIVVALSAWFTVNYLAAAEVSPGLAQVVKLHESGVGPEVLLAYVKETPISKPNADEVLYLTEKGIPKEAIIALLSKRVWSETPAPQSQPAQTQSQLPPADTKSPPATQTVVEVQQPAPTVTYVSPPPYYPYPYYYPYYRPSYYNPWPAFSVGVGIGLGHAWHHGHGWHHGHHHHGIRVHRR